MNMRRLRGLVSGTEDQVFTMSLPRKFRALYDRILLALSNFVVCCNFALLLFPKYFISDEFCANTFCCQSTVAVAISQLLQCIIGS